MRTEPLQPVYVENIPERNELQQGKIYISEKYKVAEHLCACGCKELTVTPLTKDGWRIDKNENGTISLSPSIGNFNFACQSHYFIKNNQAIFDK